MHPSFIITPFYFRQFLHLSILFLLLPPTPFKNFRKNSPALNPIPLPLISVVYMPWWKQRPSWKQNFLKQLISKKIVNIYLILVKLLTPIFLNKNRQFNVSNYAKFDVFQIIKNDSKEAVKLPRLVILVSNNCWWKPKHLESLSFFVRIYEKY